MRCGDSGFLRKDGLPCGFSVPSGKNCCHHHDTDKSRERAILLAAKLGAQQQKLPDGFMEVEWQTPEDVRLTLSRIARAALNQKGVNLKTLDTAIKAAAAANSAFQVEAIKELNETVLRAEGHGPALIILEGLKAGRTRRLPGVVERPIQTEEEAGSCLNR
jgi:hypothetical protein